MNAELIQSRLNSHENQLTENQESVKQCASQIKSILQLVQENGVQVKLMQQDAKHLTEEIKRNSHDIRSLDKGVDMNINAITEKFNLSLEKVEDEIQILKTQLLREEMRSEAKTKILNNWRTILLVIISLGGFGMSILDWWFKR
jgi:predicted RNase H-like nuclease (RuvC/YqgF family)